VGHNGHLSKAHDFKLALTRVIEPTGGPGAELATLEDAARFGAGAAVEAGATALGLRSGASVESRDNGTAERHGGGDGSDGVGVARGQLVVTMPHGWPPRKLAPGC
jgi:hypothetical protein